MKTQTSHSPLFEPSDKTDILLVDDRPENLLALESVLSHSEYNLIKANSGSEALRYLLDREPALILMDVQMPELDGFETASLIRQCERTKEIPIIFVTALNKDERFVHKGYHHGAVDYIYKPYDSYILRSKVGVFVELAKKSKRLIVLEQNLRQNERKDIQQEIAQLELKSLKREQLEQKKYIDLVEGINHGIVWSIDSDSLVISFVSPSAEKILGYSSHLWFSEKDFFLSRLHQGDRKKIMKAIQEIKTEKKDKEIEHRFLHQSGQEIWLQTGLRIAQKADGIGSELRCFSIEITKIKEAEEVLRLNKKRSDFLAEASFILSESLDYEATLRRLADLSVKKIATCFSIQITDDHGKLKPLLLKHCDSNEEPSASEWIPLLSDTVLTEPIFHPSLKVNDLKKISKDPLLLSHFQKLGVCSMVRAPLRIHNKNLGILTLFTTNPTESYQQNDLSMILDIARRIAIAIDNANFYMQAQTAIRVRDDFLSVASHELKTPLTPLKLQTQMLMRLLKTGALATLDPKRIEKILLTSDRQLDRLSILIDELLDISRISNGKLRLNLEEFDVIDLIQDILERFSGQCRSARCEIELDLPISLNVHWDRFRTEQVLINLLTNAIKYGQGSPIRIEAYLQGDQVTISFQDRGIGIAKKDQQRIFSRFERAVSGTNFAGLGLGLYIVHQVIDAHKGKIDVESELGFGSKFTFTIAIHPALNEAGETNAAPELKSTFFIKPEQGSV